MGTCLVTAPVPPAEWRTSSVGYPTPMHESFEVAIAVAYVMAYA